MGTLLEEATLSNYFYRPSEKGSTVKRKEFGSKFFPFRIDPFQKRISLQETKQKVIKVASLVKLTEHLSLVFRSLRVIFH